MCMHVCVCVCVYSCMYMDITVLVSWVFPSLLFLEQGLLCFCRETVYPRLADLQVSNDSPVSASHLDIGVLGL